MATMDLYEDFVPQTQSSRILKHKYDDDDQVFVDVEIEVGFKFFVERHISHVQLVEATQPDQGKYPSIPFPTPPKKGPTSSLFPYLCVIFSYRKCLFNNTPAYVPKLTNLSSFFGIYNGKTFYCCGLFQHLHRLFHCA